ncbi:MAG TPA: acyl-CoA dehydrogenase family protein [Acidimicrobiales bacterium]|nr:acyl-CoA dehydrogenase family protein [Acidimicrobiales bacterium]
MDLELSDDQRELQASVRAVLERECPPSLARAVIEEGKGTDELWARMVELDWPALTVPESDGGIGLGFVELAVVAEELGRVLSPAPFLATAGQFVPALRAAGSDDQRRRFLGAVAGGGIVGTVAVAEASGSWEGADLTTTATRDGGTWVLHGEKHFVFDGARADEIVVAARVGGASGQAGGDDGIGLFVVPGSSVRAEPMDDLDASRQYATVVLDGVRVDDDRVLGEPGSCGPALRRAMDEATAALSAEMVGTCQAIFDIVHTYVGEREQFGVKIGSFQAIKHKLANMFVALESARATTYFAALTIAEDDDRRGLAVATAKASVSDCQRLIAQEGIQCLGGIGYTWEHDMHMYVKRVKTTAAMFGTGALHRDRVARMIGLGAPAASA